MKTFRLLALASIIVGLTGCIPITNPETTATAATYSDGIVDSLINDVAAQTATRALGAKIVLTVDQATALKVKAKIKLAALGLKDSKDLSLLLPAILTGVQEESKNISNEASRAGIFSLIAKSSVKIVATAKVENLASKSIESIVATVTQSAVKELAASGVSKDTLVAAIGDTVNSAIQGLADNQLTSASALSSVTDKALTAVQAIAVIKADPTALTNALSQVSTNVAKAVDERVSAADKKAIIAATLKAAADNLLTFSKTDSTQDANQLLKNIALTMVNSKSGLTEADINTTFAQSSTTISVTITVTITNAQLVNLAPVASAKVTDATGVEVASLSKSGTVSLDASASKDPENSALTYEWLQISGKPLTITNASAAVATVTPTDNDLYTFLLKVSDGTKADYAKVAFSLIIPATTTNSSAAATAVTDGVAYLKTKQYDEALTKFTAAHTLDPNNNEATAWYIMATLASIGLDADTVSLAKDRLGFTGYPTTLNALLGMTWFTKDVYPSSTNWSGNGNFSYVQKGYKIEARAGGTCSRGTFTPDSTKPYISYYKLDTSIGKPSSGNYIWASGNGTFIESATGADYIDQYSFATGKGGYFAYFLDSTYTYGTAFKLPDLSVPGWASTLLTDPYDKYYTGFDATKWTTGNYSMIVLANVVARNPLGANAAIDNILAGIFGARLDLALSAISQLPDDLSIDLPTDLQTSLGVPPITGYKITKAEFLALGTFLKTFRGLFQFVSAYNLTLPLSPLAYDPTLGNSSWDFTGFASPFKAGGLLTARVDAADRLAKAKATLVSCIEDSIAVMTAARTKIDAPYMTQFVGGSSTTMIKSIIDVEVASATKIKNALVSGTDLIVASQVAMSSNGAPNIDSLYPAVAGTNDLIVNSTKVFEPGFFSPANFLELNTAKTEPIWYKRTSNWGNSSTNYQNIDTFDLLTENTTAHNILNATGGSSGYLDGSAYVKVKTDYFKAIVKQLPNGGQFVDQYLPVGPSAAYDKIHQWFNQ